MPRCCYSAVTAKTVLLELGVTKETGVCRRLVDSAVDSKTALLELQFPAAGFQAGFHGIRHFLDWLQGMVTGKVTAEPCFSDWYARPRYASWYAQNAMAQDMQVQAGAIRY